VTADQTLVVDAPATARALAPVLGVDARTLADRLRGDRRFVYVDRGVTPQTWARVDRLGLPGIFHQRTSRRIYPDGALAGNVLGFVGADGAGLEGLEWAYDKPLAGRDGRAVYQTTGGRWLADPRSRQPVAGEDLVLTIDRDIQWKARQELARAVRETGASSGTVVVLDPRTGDTLALASVPSVDPRRPTATPPALRGDPAVTEVYEPGSTGKLITATALLSAGVVDPGTRFRVPNRLERAGKSFKDFENHATLKLTYAGTIARSSNIGTILAAERLGDFARLYPWYARFGIGQGLGPDFPGANPGQVLPPDQWSVTTPYTMVFGQSYSVNAVEMASVVATIAGGGVRHPPRVVRASVDQAGHEHPRPEPPARRVMSQATATTITHMMEAVTGPGGTAPVAAIPGYRVAGKTGTAQRYDAACGCYRGYTMSFIGFAPADDPALVVAVTLQQPKRGVGGGATAGPVFRDVLSFALATLHVPPTGTRPARLATTW
jgi:cell division protein FtsI (penicillin-binding protein 3)